MDEYDAECCVCGMQNLERFIEIAGREALGNEYVMSGYYALCIKCANDTSVLLELSRCAQECIDVPVAVDN